MQAEGFGIAVIPPSGEEKMIEDKDYTSMALRRVP